LGDQPAKPPRAITPRVLKLAWIEPRARFWLLAGLVLLAAASHFAITRYMDWHHSAQLIRNGTVLQATVDGINGSSRITLRNQPPESLVDLSYTINGRPYQLSSVLLAGRDTVISIKDQVAIRVDPNNPTDWTSRNDVTPLSHALLSAELILPVAIPCLLAGIWLRLGVIRIWRDGQSALMVVHDARHTSLAPASRLVRCNAVDGFDRRLIPVYVPQRLAHPQPGDQLWIVHVRGKPQKALAAVVYES
jgi:hypothetical protein